jgi:regulator of RNase E activity RraB
MLEAFPNDSDGDVLRQLIATGSDLSAEMEIDFCVSAPDESSGLEFSTEAQKIGFCTDVSQDSESGRWTCYCTRTMVPAYEEIIHIQELLNAIGKDFDCFSDGWGTFGNNPLNNKCD